jgi:DNA-binding transcriptional ArsR family regulator
VADDPRAGARQDGTAPGSAVPEVAEERQVSDLATLRILADPLRLAILDAFPAGPEYPPMTVKEIAEVLDEGQTKLYRHVKQLEESGLIHVAETRVVSGIIEKRYRPSQHRLTVESDLLRLTATDEYHDTLVAVVEAARAGLSADLRAGRVATEKPADGPDLSIKLGAGKGRMTPEHFARVREKLAELFDEVNENDDEAGTVPVFMQVMLYATPESPAQDTEKPPSTKSS